MEGPSLLILWLGIGVGVILVCFGVILFWRTRWKTKSTEQENIFFKNPKDVKCTPVPVQVQLNSTDLDLCSGDFDQRIDFKHLSDLRRGEVDPLLGVLYNNQLRKAHSEGNVAFGKNNTLSAVERKNPFGESAPAADLDLKKIQSQECILEGLKANLALVWVSSDQSLSILIMDLQRLPQKSASSTILVNVYLESPTSRSEGNFQEKKELSRDRSVALTFQGLRLYDIEKSKIWVTLLEKKTNTSKEATVAKGAVALSDMILVPNKPLSLTVHLEYLESYVTSHSFQKKYGSIVLSIKNTFTGPVSARFTIELKRAENLVIQRPGASFKAELFIMNSSEKLHYFYTPFQKGASPQWNCSFSFDVCIDDVDDLCMELTLMKLSKLNGTTKFGKGVLSASTGSSLWREAIESCGKHVNLKQPLLSPHLEVGSWSVHEKRLGLMLVSMESTYTRKHTKAKIKFVVKTLAHFQHNKSGGNYKIDIDVMKKEVIINNFETGLVSSTEMIWNAPFAFDVVEDEVDDYKINLTLIRIGRTRRSSKIGWTQIGRDSHCILRDCLKPPRRIIDNWHYLLSF